MTTAKRTPAPAERPGAELQTNEPQRHLPAGGAPARGVNDWQPEVDCERLAAGLNPPPAPQGDVEDPHRYGAGAPMSVDTAKLQRGPMDPRHAQQTAHQVILQVVKRAAEQLAERFAASVKSAKEPKLRSRSEVVIFTPNGVLGIKKGTYLLMPGGGIDDGETPEAAAYREAIEEADRKLLHLQPMGCVEAIWPADNKLVEGYDGERSYFFLAMDGGTLGTTHDDNEPFEAIGFSEAEKFLQGLIDDDTQAWARDANLARMRCLVAARQQAEEGRRPEKLAAVVADVLLRGMCDLHTTLASLQNPATTCTERTARITTEAAAS